MRHTLLAAALATLTVAAPAQAVTLYSNNFDAENGGASALNYTNFNNLTVTGQVDLVFTGDGFGVTCASGGCVDLAGTPGPGGLSSTLSYAFNAGDTLVLSVDLSGNGRPNSDPGDDDFRLSFNFGSDTALANYGENLFGSAFNFGPGLLSGFNSGGAVASTAPFGPRSIFFTAAQAGSVSFAIDTTSADNFGPIIDNLSLTNDAVAAIPEPSSWAMMIGGFGLAGGMLRTRARRLRFAA